MDKTGHLEMRAEIPCAGADGRVNVRSVETWTAGHRILRRYSFEYRRRDGTIKRLTRDVYERGDSVAVLLWSRARRTVVLTRQFRLPAFVMGHPDGMLVEVPGGLCDADTPAKAARREVEEETGYRIGRAQEAFSAYMSPSVVAECVHFLVAELDEATRVSPGGGREDEDEELDVLEIPLDVAIGMINRREIVDGRTIIMLQYAKLNRLTESQVDAKERSQKGGDEDSVGAC